VNSIRLSGFSHTTGLGLRVKTPLGPIRLDYGYNLNLPEYLRDFKPRPEERATSRTNGHHDRTAFLRHEIYAQACL